MHKDILGLGIQSPDSLKCDHMIALYRIQQMVVVGYRTQRRPLQLFRRTPSPSLAMGRNTKPSKGVDVW
jgi:hypothetical protein